MNGTTFFLILGTLCLVVGFGGNIFVSRRKFYRTNNAGVEEFRGFGHAVGVQLLESVIGLVSWLLIGAGAVSLVWPFWN